jgi:hypothetical protein
LNSIDSGAITPTFLGFKGWCRYSCQSQETQKVW